MRNENDISKSLSIIQKKEKYDACCKRVLANKEILAWILKCCVKEFQDCEIDDIKNKYIDGDPVISGIAVHRDEGAPERIGNVSKEDSSVNEGTAVYDICFNAFAPTDGEPVKLIINLEAQKDFYPGYPIVRRGMYYCSRMVSAQYGTEFTGSAFMDIKKVYSIWICTRPPAYLADSLARFKTIMVNEDGKWIDRPEDYGISETIIICLGKNYDEIERKIIKLLSIIFSSEQTLSEKKDLLESEFRMKMTKTEESEVAEMCNVSEGIWEEAMEQGVLKGKLESIRNLMDRMNLSVEVAMDSLNIPEEERADFKRLVLSSK